MKNTGTLVGATVRPADSEDKYPVALGREVKGAPFKVNTLADLYALTSESHVLEEDVTIVTVMDSDGSGIKRRYELIDITAIDSQTGLFLPEAWEIFSTGGGSSPSSQTFESGIYESGIYE